MNDLTLFLIIGSVIVLILLIVGIIVSSNSERSLVERRLGQYLEGEKSEEERKAERSVLTEWVNRRVEKSSIGDRISSQLARADLKFQVGEYFALILISVMAWQSLPGFWRAVVLVCGAVLPLWLARWWDCSCRLFMSAASKRNA
jgi:hypothetical protein